MRSLGGFSFVCPPRKKTGVSSNRRDRLFHWLVFTPTSWCPSFPDHQRIRSVFQDIDIGPPPPPHLPSASLGGVDQSVVLVVCHYTLGRTDECRWTPDEAWNYPGLLVVIFWNLKGKMIPFVIVADRSYRFFINCYEITGYKSLCSMLRLVKSLISLFSVFYFKE